MAIWDIALLNIFSGKKRKVRTDTLTVSGHLLRWGDVVLQIGNVSIITTESLFPWLRLFFSIILIATGFPAALSSIPMLFSRYILVAIPSVLISCLITFLGWKLLPKKKDTAMHIHLNSGYVYSIVFTDKAFMNKVLDTFAKTFEKGWGNFTVNQSNKTINYGTIISGEDNVIGDISNQVQQLGGNADELQLK